MIKIIEATSCYKFVRYHIYSNGTLVDNYINFLKHELVLNNVDRFHV
jgi:hypothetical protein